MKAASSATTPAGSGISILSSCAPHPFVRRSVADFVSRPHVGGVRRARVSAHDRVLLYDPNRRRSSMLLPKRFRGAGILLERPHDDLELTVTFWFPGVAAVLHGPARV